VQNSISFGAGVSTFENLNSNVNYIIFSPISNDTVAAMQGTTTAAISISSFTTSAIGNSTQFNGSLTYFATS
jgi:hypothetical protein